MPEQYLALGSFELLCGPTGSGKSERLKQRAKLLEFQKGKYLWVEPNLPGLIDLTSEEQWKNGSKAILSPAEPYQLLSQLDNHSHVFIDNIHGFQGPAICDTIEILMKKGIQVIGAGNDMDFRGEPFNEMGALLCISTEVHKFTTQCYKKNCNNLATVTQRFIDKIPASHDSPTIIAGENIEHRPVCYDHLKVPNKMVTLPADYVRVDLGPVPNLGKGHNPNVKLYFIEAIVGPMCGGKTLLLIDKVKKWNAYGLNWTLIKAETARGRGPVSSRETGEHFPTEFIDDNNPFKILDYAKNVECIGIDEGQFFSDDISYVIRDLARAGKHVVVTGLDMSFKREPIGSMPKILCAANHVEKVYAGCSHEHCNRQARYSQRYLVTLAGDKQTILKKTPAAYDLDTICAGSLEQDTLNYEATCLLHNEVPGKPVAIPEKYLNLVLVKSG